MSDDPEKNDQQDDRESKEFTEENDVQIDTTIIGDCVLIVNGDRISGNPDSPNKIHMTLRREGDVICTIDGEDFMHDEEGQEK